MKIINKFSYSNLAFLIILLFFTSCSNLKKGSYTSRPETSKKSIEETTQPQIPKDELDEILTSRKKLRIPRIITKRAKIAVLLPLSGPHKEIGEDLLNAVTLSLFDNDQDNNIELEIFDSKGTSFGAKSAIKKIAEQDIKIVIGPLFSSSTEAIIKTVRKNEIIVLSLSNNMDLAGNQGIFLMGITPEQQIEKIVTYTIDSGRNNFSVIAPNNKYGLKIANILKKVTQMKDGNFVSSEFYANHQNIQNATKRIVNSYTISERAYEDLTEEELKSSEIPVEEEYKIYSDVILIPESGSTLSRIISSVKKNNINERDFQIIGTNQWDDISTLNNPDLVGSWFASPTQDVYKEFEKKYYQTYNMFPVRISSIAYDATSVVIELLKKYKGGELYIDDFTEYESSRNGFMGIDGLFRFLPNGIVQRNLAVLEVGNGEFEVIAEPMEIFLEY